MTGGITRSVRLFAVPGTNLARLHTTTDLDDEYTDATLNLQLSIANETTKSSDAISVTVELLDPKGQRVEFESNEIALPSVPAGELQSHEVSIPVCSPKKWNAEHPSLYRLHITLLEGNRPRETVQRRIGFRQIEVRDKQLLVNGTAVKLRGSCRHLAHPLRGRSPTPELARLDAELFKKANCNFIRTSHYPPSEEFIAACDELGLYVEEEAPFCFYRYDEADAGLSLEDVARYCTYANLKMAQRDLSHPSVIIWSIANELHWGPHFEAAARAVARMDPSRPRTFMWLPDEADVLNVAASHYPGPNDVTKTDTERPKLFSEYCHLPAYVPHEMFTDPAVEDQWGALLKLTWGNLYQTKGALGGAVWCGVDDDFHLPPVDQEKDYQMRGVADWGVLDGWRRPKPEYWHLRKCYSPFRILVSEIDANAGAGMIEIPVENRYDFTNLSELSVAWRLGDQSGVIRADVPPRSEGVLRLPKVDIHAGHAFYLEVTGPDGWAIDEYALPLRGAGEDVRGRMASIRGANDPPDAWRLIHETESFLLRRGDVTVRIDRSTGKSVEAKIGTTLVLCGGPHWSFVPTFSKHQQRAMKGETPRPAPVYGTNWRCDSVEDGSSDEEACVHVRGAYDEAGLEFVYRFQKDGGMTIEYESTLQPKVVSKGDLCFLGSDPSDPSAEDYAAFVRFCDDGMAEVRRRQPDAEPIEVPADRIMAVPRQMGMRLELPRELDALQWERDALWSVYPADHIGRPRGTASAFVAGLDTRELPGQKPEWPWSQTASDLGTRDFRSTKRNLYRASLTDDHGYGLEIIAGGNQHARSYVVENRIHWLIADLDNGPSETFMRGYFNPRRKPLPLGVPIRGTIHCQFLAPTD